MEKLKTDILILGGGLSGLLTAEMLYRRKKDITILEKETQIGGLARTFNFNGFKFDIGGHKLCIKDSRNRVYFKDIIKDNELMVLRRKSKTFFNNRYIDYPVTLSSIFALKKKDIFNIFLDMLNLRNNFITDNFEDWIITNYGKCLYKIYFKDYTEKVWGLPCDKLSSIWADKRIGSNNIFKLLRNIIMCHSNVKDSERFFYYPRDGTEVIVKSLEQRLKDKCKIYTNVQLIEFLNGNDKLCSLSFLCNGQKFEVCFKKAISTIPIKELIKIIPHVPQEIIQTTNNGIRYRNVIIVCFVINRKLISNWHWCYFPSKDIVFSRIYEPKFWSRNLACEDKTMLSMEIFCDNNDFYWRMKEDDLIAKAKESLRYSRLINSNDMILDACVKKINYAYPLKYYGYERPLNKVKNFLNSFRNLFLIGRNGTHSYFDMEECFDDVRNKTKLI